MEEWIKNVLYILMVSVFVDIISSTLSLNKFIRLVTGIIVIIIIITPITRITEVDTLTTLENEIRKLETKDLKYRNKTKEYNPNKIYLDYVKSKYEEEIKDTLNNNLKDFEVESISLKSNDNNDGFTKVEVYLRKERKNEEFNIIKENKDEKINEKIEDYKEKFSMLEDRQEAINKIKSMLTIEEEKINIYFIG